VETTTTSAPAVQDQAPVTAPAAPAASQAAPVTAPAQAPSQAAQDYQSVRDALANYGYDVRGQFQDDHAALQHLASLARQAQEQQSLLPYAQQYMQHAAQFQQYLAERQRAAQAAQAAQQSWWTAPEYDPSWQQKLMRDPQTGEIRALPGHDPSIVQKYLAWVDHQRGFLDRFARDPIGSIRPGIEQVVQAIVQQQVQQSLGQYQEQSLASQFLAQNADWLYERGANGAPVRDARTGRPALSSLGQQFARYVYEAEQMGLMDTASQQRYALGLLQRDYLLATAQQGAPAQQPPAGGTAAPPRFAQAAAAPAGPANGGYKPPSGASPRGLMEEMMRQFQAAGIQPGQQLV